MKLSRLYADKPFKSIVFNVGLNVVLAKVTQKTDLAKDSHNLGKTTLITVIDFMLLKQLSDAGHIFKKYKERFNGYTFFLEIILNDGTFLTIRRSVDSPTRISFRLSKTSMENLIDSDTWDEAGVAFEPAQELLNKYLGFDVLPDYDYRKSVTYFLRTQKDYNDVFQLAKFQKNKDIDWKPFMFDLLGFNGQDLVDKYLIDIDIADQKRFIACLKVKLEVYTNEVDKIKGAISLKKTEQLEFENQIDNFNFYQEERRLNRDLVERVEQAISDLNTQEYNIEFDLDKTKQSFSQNISIDIDQLRRVYEETKIYFPESLVKDYRELDEFNRRITEERNKYLEERISQLSDQLKAVRQELLSYDQQRNRIMSVLKDKDAFKKFKVYQNNLTQIEGDLVRLEEKLNSIDKIAVLDALTEELKGKLDQVVKQIKIQVAASDENKIYSEIRRLFNNIFRYILKTPALLFIKINKENNIEFAVDVARENEIEVTAEGKGNSYQKLLCISFDLSVLAAYRYKSFFRFVYHDGALEGLDNRKKLNYVQLVREYCSRYDLQYIFTAIEHDIPPEIMKQFKPAEICLTLNDSGDEGKLFGFSF